MSDAVRILLLADSHLGFDLPIRPRVRRRRRGHDFQANYETALAPALRGEVDVVVHGGDVFHRSRVPPSLAWQGLEPLVRVAESGVPVLVVPGNHERARLPHARFARHPRVHVFDRPRSVELDVRGARLRFFGFPFQRRDVRARFRELLRLAGWFPAGAGRGSPVACDGHGRGGRLDGIGRADFLCMHQCFEGATVGPNDFTFTRGDDVVRAADLPPGLAAVLCGHIHRHQVLTTDLRGEPLPAPVLYPGSIERTAVAEQDETKGYLLLELDPGRTPAPLRWRFVRLPARPLVVRDLDIDGLGPRALDAALRALIADAPPDAVLRIRTRGAPRSAASMRMLAARRLRRVAPDTMNVEVRAADARDAVRRAGSGRQRSAQTTLDL